MADPVLGFGGGGGGGGCPHTLQLGCCKLPLKTVQFIAGCIKSNAYM